MCSFQNRRRSFWEVGENDDGFGLRMGMGPQLRVVARRMVTENGFGTGRSFDAQELGADGNAAVGTDFDLGAQAPDKGPPGAVGFGAQRGAFFFKRQVPGFLGSHLEFTVDFVVVAVATQGLKVRIGLVQVGDVLAGEIGRQALLPIEVATLDLTFSLGGRSKTKGDAIEVKGLAQLGEGFGVMSEEQAVEIHIEFQRQTVLLECGGQEIKVGQEQFAFINFGTGEKPAAIVEHVEHGKGLGAAGEPAVGRGVQLPEFTDVAALPAPDRSGGTVVGLWVSQVMLYGPTSDLSAVDSELAFAERLAGGKAVGSWRFAAQPFAQQRLHLRRPVGSMIASRCFRRPHGLLMVGTGLEVIAVKFVEAAAGEAELFHGGRGFEFLGSKCAQHVTNQRGGAAVSQLELFVFFIR